MNAISPTSGAHLRDKLKRILEVLGGQHVDVGGRRVSANENVTGVAFVKDLFAEKIVVSAGYLTHWSLGNLNEILDM